MPEEFSPWEIWHRDIELWGIELQSIYYWDIKHPGNLVPWEFGIGAFGSGIFRTSIKHQDMELWGYLVFGEFSAWKFANGTFRKRALRIGVFTSRALSPGALNTAGTELWEFSVWEI